MHPNPSDLRATGSSWKERGEKKKDGRRRDAGGADFNPKHDSNPVLAREGKKKEKEREIFRSTTSLPYPHRAVQAFPQVFVNTQKRGRRKKEGKKESSPY